MQSRSWTLPGHFSAKALGKATQWRTQAEDMGYGKHKGQILLLNWKLSAPPILSAWNATISNLPIYKVRYGVETAQRNSIKFGMLELMYMAIN